MSQNFNHEEPKAFSLVWLTTGYTDPIRIKGSGVGLVSGIYLCDLFFNRPFWAPISPPLRGAPFRCTFYALPRFVWLKIMRPIGP